MVSAVETAEPYPTCVFSKKDSKEKYEGTLVAPLGCLGGDGPGTSAPVDLAH
ncbi:hypothetical protein JK364_53700, partial [Streptomyces sp. 110]|nr:hypothetical protein [Streptomyces endocoffeicus]